MAGLTDMLHRRPDRTLARKRMDRALDDEADLVASVRGGVAGRASRYHLAIA